MRHRALYCLAFALLPVAAVAQTAPNPPTSASSGIGIWEHVEALPDGAEITVDSTHGRKIHCLFAGADSEHLFCDPRMAWAGRQGYRFDRSHVFAVRMGHTRRNARILIGGLAAAGFAAGVSLPNYAFTGDVTPRVVNGVALGGIGAFAGLLASPFLQFVPGELIYRVSAPQPHAASATKRRLSCSGR
jgi:hypothetical protein